MFRQAYADPILKLDVFSGSIRSGKKPVVCRLLSFDGNDVTFLWRDYAHGNKQKKMTVPAEEFIRRFLLHVLPKGFVRIRHFGFMANSQCSGDPNAISNLEAMIHNRELSQDMESQYP